ncbi:MAG: hypothetical protein ACP5RD_04090 [bacterium]
MLKKSNNKFLLIFIIFLYFIIINVLSLILFEDNKVEAGVLVPPKGFEYKYDPEAPNPLDKTEEGSEELEKKPKKIYYYPPDLFKNYYQSHMPNKGITNSYDNQNNSVNVTVNNDDNQINIKKSNNEVSLNLMNFLLIIASLSIIVLVLGVFYINYLKQKELQNTVPVYMKYSETKAKLKKRRTVFDVKK